MSFFPQVVDLSAKTSGLYKSGTTKLHPLGTIGKCDLRTFVYAMAGNTLNGDLGAMNSLTQCMAYAAVAASCDAEAVEVTVDFGAADGAAGDGVVAVDELIGGYLLVFPHDDNSFTILITGNTAADGGGDEITVTLAHGVPVALVVDADHAEIIHSPYYNVQQSAAATTSVMGMPMCVGAANEYLWLQTAGPCWIAPQAAVSVGNNNRLCVFRHDGSIDELDYSDANNAQGQIAGWVIANASGAGQGAAFIFLTIGPM